MAFGTNVKIEHGSVVMDPGVQRGTDLLHHVYIFTVRPIMEKDGFCKHQNCITHKKSNFVFFASQWDRREELFLIVQNLQYYHQLTDAINLLKTSSTICFTNPNEKYRSIFGNFVQSFGLQLQNYFTVNQLQNFGCNFCYFKAKFCKILIPGFLFQ
jgi:hypothetical protein